LERSRHKKINKNEKASSCCCYDFDEPNPANPIILAISSSSSGSSFFFLSSFFCFFFSLLFSLSSSSCCFNACNLSSRSIYINGKCLNIYIYLKMISTFSFTTTCHIDLVWDSPFFSSTLLIVLEPSPS
jgi:hypothetical protein